MKGERSLKRIPTSFTRYDDIAAKNLVEKNPEVRFRRLFAGHSLVWSWERLVSRAASSLKFVGRERETPVWGFFIFNARFIGALVSAEDIRAEAATFVLVSVPMPMPLSILMSISIPMTRTPTIITTIISTIPSGRICQ